MSLTARQQRFVDEYLLDLNATQAAVRAGYSARSASAIGFENLRKPEIGAAICEAQAERACKTRVTADDVLRELWSIAQSSSSARTRVLALSWVGKHLAMFTQRVQMSEELPKIHIVLSDDPPGIPTESPSGNGFG
jgi:phage terminase small subunit